MKKTCLIGIVFFLFCSEVLSTDNVDTVSLTSLQTNDFYVNEPEEVLPASNDTIVIVRHHPGVCSTPRKRLGAFFAAVGVTGVGAFLGWIVYEIVQVEAAARKL